MNVLRLDTLTMPAADLGQENPLPPLQPSQELHSAKNIDPAVPVEMRRNMTYGHLPNLLPYHMQDGYNREKRLRNFRVAVLENDLMRATFLLEYGGRLWSLFHKPSGRELLSVNPVFQPANLALRNAWFSGGVEWNIGTIGHSPFTCSPLFAARLHSPDETPILRLYEWERIRQVTYQIDAWLSDDSPVLFVRVSIHNPRDCAVPMYWWSNIAVPESPGVRVLAPADCAYRYTYDRLQVIPIPEYEGVDNTYPAAAQNAADFFFHIPEDRQPWIAAVDGDGKGLFQTSTSLLKGRKLFVWGQGRGGHKWQEFLSEPGQAYLEIQAGLARTQFEHLLMPAHARWDWLEAYGLIQADSGMVHGTDWNQATNSLAESIKTTIPYQKLETELARSLAWRDQTPDEILQHGTGWGALEQKRRAVAAEPALACPGLIFDDHSIDANQQPWFDLLSTGQFPVLGLDDFPTTSLVQPEWQSLLENASNLKENWSALFHLGLIKYFQEDLVGARQAWQKSLALAKTPWVLRNLAFLDAREKSYRDALQKYVQACRLRPDLYPLAVECGNFMLANNFASQWLELLAELSQEVRQKGRIWLLEARANLMLGDLRRTGYLIEIMPVIEDIREGELSLSQLWDDYQVQRLSLLENCPVDDALRQHARKQFPLPERFDFRMTAADIAQTGVL